MVASGEHKRLRIGALLVDCGGVQWCLRSLFLMTPGVGWFWCWSRLSIVEYRRRRIQVVANGGCGRLSLWGLSVAATGIQWCFCLPVLLSAPMVGLGRPGAFGGVSRGWSGGWRRTRGFPTTAVVGFSRLAAFADVFFSWDGDR